MDLAVGTSRCQRGWVPSVGSGGLFFLGVTALLGCGPSSHFSPSVAHVLTSPSPTVTLLTPSLTSEDSWDYIASTPVTQKGLPRCRSFL